MLIRSPVGHCQLAMWVQIWSESIIAGSDASCLPTLPPSSSLAVIQSNVTGTLQSCQPWGLKITGGQKPYSVVLPATQSNVTVITLGQEDDTLTYINRAPPNSTFVGECQAFIQKTFFNLN